MTENISRERTIMRNMDKARTSAEVFLALKGYEIYDSKDNKIVANDNGTLVFVEVSYSHKTFPADDINQSEMENYAAKYMADHEVACDTNVRLDNLAVCIVKDDQALIRHHVNSLAIHKDKTYMDKKRDMADLIMKMLGDEEITEKAAGRLLAELNKESE